MASEDSWTSGLPQAYHDFWHWVEHNRVYGINGHGTQVQYVPPHKLQEYWDWDRVANFPGIDEKAYSIDHILEHRLIIFSILVFISEGSNSRVGYLSTFSRTDIDDHTLPIRQGSEGETNPSPQYPDHVPHPFPHQEEGAAVWKAFDKWQWQFCPIVFLPNGRLIEKIYAPLDVRHIRPVTILKELSRRTNGATRLLKVQPHQSSRLPEVSIPYKLTYSTYSSRADVG
jgi:hypothetical protein